AISSAPAWVDMCSPSAISATEPNQMPPTISTTIITAQIAMTIRVLRALWSCASPKKTWLWRCASPVSIVALLRPAYQIVFFGQYEYTTFQNANDRRHLRIQAPDRRRRRALRRDVDAAWAGGDAGFHAGGDASNRERAFSRNRARGRRRYR